MFKYISNAWISAQKDAKPDYMPPFREILRVCINKRSLRIYYIGTKVWGVSADNQSYSVYRLTFIFGILAKKELIGTTDSPYSYGDTVNLDDCLYLQMKHLNELIEMAKTGVRLCTG